MGRRASKSVVYGSTSWSLAHHSRYTVVLSSIVANVQKNINYRIYFLIWYYQKVHYKWSSWRGRASLCFWTVYCIASHSYPSNCLPFFGIWYILLCAVQRLHYIQNSSMFLYRYDIFNTEWLVLIWSMFVILMSFFTSSFIIQAIVILVATFFIDELSMMEAYRFVVQLSWTRTWVWQKQ